MRIEKGDTTYRDLGYNKHLSRKIGEASPAILRGDIAQGDLEGTYPRPQVNWDNFRVNYLTTEEPAYAEGRLYYNLTTGKLNIGGADGWEEITSTVVPSESKSPSVSPSTSPSGSPSISVSASPSISVSLSPSRSPSLSLSASPSVSLSVSPSASPSVSPSVSPGT
jgi:hypothetical protein